MDLNKIQQFSCENTKMNMVAIIVSASSSYQHSLFNGTRSYDKYWASTDIRQYKAG